MLLADVNDVKLRLKAEASQDLDESYAIALVAEASALVESYLGRTFEPGGVPEAVSLVVSRMAARVLMTPDETGMATSMQVTAGVFNRSVSYSNGGGSVWLNASDKTMLAPYRRRRGGLYSLTLT